VFVDEVYLEMKGAPSRGAENRRTFVLQRRAESYLSRDANRYLAFDPGQRHALQEIALREKEDGNHR
jgi:hypothetical protein